MCDEGNGKPNCEYMNRELYEEVRKREWPVEPRKWQDYEGHETVDPHTVDRSEQEGLPGKKGEKGSSKAVNCRGGKSDNKMKESAQSCGWNSSLKSRGAKSGAGNALQCSRGIDASHPEHN